MILKNISGAVASLPSVNAIGIANGATIDLGIQVDGAPLTLDAKIQTDPAVYIGIASGDWAIVIGGVELDLPTSLAAVASASVADTDGAVRITVPETVIAKNEDLSLFEIGLDVGSGAVVKVTGMIRFLRSGATDGASICAVSSIDFVGYRRSIGGMSVVRPEVSASTDENLKFGSYVSGTFIGIQARCTASAGTLSADLRVCATTETL